MIGVCVNNSLKSFELTELYFPLQADAIIPILLLFAFTCNIKDTN